MLHNKSELYGPFFRFAEGNHILALIFITIIGLGPLMLMSFKQDPRSSWTESFWFIASLVWFGMVCVDITGVASWLNQGSQLPQIVSR